MTSYLCIDLHIGLFASGFPTNILYAFIFCLVDRSNLKQNLSPVTKIGIVAAGRHEGFVAAESYS